MARKKCARKGCRRSVKSETALYCADPACERARARARRQKADRAARGEAPPAPPSEDSAGRPAGGVFAATLVELEKAGRVNTPAGQSALALATRIDHSAEDSGSSVAQLSKQHLAALEVAMRGADERDDSIDELRARREKRARGA